MTQVRKKNITLEMSLSQTVHVVKRKRQRGEEGTGEWGTGQKGCGVREGEEGQSQSRKRK